ncbi:MAG: IS110 family transposase [Corynebacterium sp.]|uniref:IS110 family transposase n=1 Tax=Corynebacterium sp. TaxID=1720 RepID=UPI0026494A77|nr:IS110 family transposase [Corynebacterium sp.]MDN5724241.1 IS110 family transposase [Corynebacterium sp.]MDN5896456.1 IS110 family transposase [Nocardioides sp.]
MSIVAETYRYVIGVDTHARHHAYVVLDARTGAEVEHRQFPTSPAGLLRASDWIVRRTGQATDGDLDLVLVSMEGTRSYGAQAATLLAQAGYRVVDAPAPKREHGAGKDDHLDALAAARGTLFKDADRLADARAGDTSAILQILLTARSSITGERTRAINALTALLRTHDLGIDARRKPSRETIKAVAAWRTRATDTPVQATARAETIRRAQRILALYDQAEANEQDLLTIVRQSTPTLLQMPGIGPVNAAIVIAAWSHPGRIHSAAAFAKLAGACPLKIESGNSTNHRLNRTGDRQLNRALHTIANNRMTYDSQTRDYVARRTVDGMSKPRIRRCLKRAIAGQLYRHLEHTHAA